MMFSATNDAQIAIELNAIVFRDDQSVEAVTLTDLSFTGCKLASDAHFSVGERLRLHLQGQGLIELTVEQSGEGRTAARFETLCHV